MVILTEFIWIFRIIILHIKFLQNDTKTYLIKFADYNFQHYICAIKFLNF